MDTGLPQVSPASQQATWLRSAPSPFFPLFLPAPMVPREMLPLAFPKLTKPVRGGDVRLKGRARGDGLLFQFAIPQAIAQMVNESPEESSLKGEQVLKSH